MPGDGVDRAEKVRTLVDARGAVANRDVARALRISPATSHRLLRALVTAGVLQRAGAGPAARYALRPVRRRFALAGLDEDRAWRQVSADVARIRPLDEEEARSLRYAASEVINNAIDHSGGRRVEVDVAFEQKGTTVTRVRDDGVGVFRRVCETFGFATPADAIVQLEKGKLTSDPSRHSGEGLFFSSKVVSRFRIESRGAAWVVDNLIHDSTIAASGLAQGTLVTLTTVRGRTPRLAEAFAAYTDPETLRFGRTRVTVKLSALGDAFVSRSEARRLVARWTDFTHVTLDFSGVEMVGQGFCDEVFRVFASRHPAVTIEPVGMNDPVAFMVGRARARVDLRHVRKVPEGAS